MSLEERNPNYFEGKPWSRFHRTNLPADASMIDIDYPLFCARCGKTLAVVEETKDLSQFKPATVTRRLGLDLRVPAFRIYIEGDPANPTALRVQRLAETDGPLVRITAKAWNEWEQRLREEHAAVCSALFDGTGGDDSDPWT